MSLFDAEETYISVSDWRNVIKYDIKNITLYYLILACKIKNIPCSLWGHALFKKNYEASANI